MNLLKDIKTKLKNRKKYSKYSATLTTQYPNIRDFVPIRQNNNYGCGAPGSGFTSSGSPITPTYFDFSTLYKCNGASPQPVLFDLLGGNNGISSANKYTTSAIQFNNPRASTINIGNPQSTTNVQQLSGTPVKYDNPYITCPSNYFDQIMAQSFGGIMDIVDQNGNRLFTYQQNLNPISASFTNNSSNPTPNPNAANLWPIGQLNLGTGSGSFSVGNYGTVYGGSPGFYPNTGTNNTIANSVFKTANIVWIPPNMVMDILYFGTPQDIQALSTSNNINWNQYCQGVNYNSGNNVFQCSPNNKGGSYSSMLWIVRIIGDSGDNNNSAYYVNPIDWCQNKLPGNNSGNGTYNPKFIGNGYYSPNVSNYGWGNTPGNTFFANVDLSSYNNSCYNPGSGTMKSCSPNAGSGLVDLGCVNPITYYNNNNDKINNNVFQTYGTACCQGNSYANSDISLPGLSSPEMIGANMANMGMSFIVYYKSGYDSNGNINNNIPMTWQNYVLTKCLNGNNNPQCGVIGKSINGSIQYPQSNYLTGYAPPPITPCTGTSNCSDYSAGCPVVTNYTKSIGPSFVPKDAPYSAITNGAICYNGNCACAGNLPIGQSLTCYQNGGDCTGVIACPSGFTSSCNLSNSVCNCFCMKPNYPIQTKNPDGTISISCGTCPAGTTASVDNSTGYTTCITNTNSIPSNSIPSHSTPKCTNNDQCAGCPTGMTPVCNDGKCGCSVNPAPSNNNDKKIIEDVFGIILILVLIISIAVVSIHYYKKYKNNKSSTTIVNSPPIST